jgi:anti-sigma factor RsiW
MGDLDESTLVAYVDGELDPAAMRDVGLAIERDAEAREKVRLLRLSASLAQAAFRDPVYQRVSARLVEAVRADGFAPSVGPLRRWRPALPLAATILAAVIFAGGFLLGVDHQERPGFSEASG